MPRAAVEIDDKDRRAEGRRRPQHPQPRAAAEIIGDQPPQMLVVGAVRHHAAAGSADLLGQRRQRLGELAERLAARRPTAHRCRGRAGRTSHRHCAAGSRAASATPVAARNSASRIAPVAASAPAQRSASWR